MNRINYNKNCIKHEAVSRAKRMLNKTIKQFGDLRTFYCNISLTGVSEIDNREVKSYIENHLRNLKGQIKEQLLENEKYINGEINENYEDGYYPLQFEKELQIVKAFNDVSLFIKANYPELKVKTTELTLTKDSEEEKLTEVQRYFKNNPVFGFCQKYYAVLENGKRERLHSFAYSCFLRNAKSVRCEFFYPD